MNMDELIHFDYRLVMRLTPPEPGTPEHQAKAKTPLRCAKPKNATFAERQVWLKLPPLHPCAQLRFQLIDVFVYFFVGNTLNS